MKKTNSIILAFASMFLLQSCIKDRLYVPDNANPANPAPVDSTIKLSINEFLASNNTISIPGYAYFPDWIEIYNAGEIDVNLAGYSISDDMNNKEKFVIPSGFASTIIKAKSYLLILADDSVTLGPLHTNFSLSKSGESIGLFSPQQTGIDSVTYPTQVTDKSYGRLPGTNGTWQQLTTPTPNAANY